MPPQERRLVLIVNFMIHVIGIRGCYLAGYALMFGGREEYRILVGFPCLAKNFSSAAGASRILSTSD